MLTVVYERLEVKCFSVFLTRVISFLLQMWNPKRIVKSNHPYNPPIKLCTALRRSKVCLFFCHGLWSLGLTQIEGLHSGTNHRPTPWSIWLCPRNSIRSIFIHSFILYTMCLWNITKSYCRSFCHYDPNFRSPLTIGHCFMDMQWVRLIAGIISALKVDQSVLNENTNFGILFSFSGSSQARTQRVWC